METALIKRFYCIKNENYLLLTIIIFNGKVNG